MALTRWEPFEGLTSLRREMDRLFEHFFVWTPATLLGNGGARQLQPCRDVRPNCMRSPEDSP